MGQGCTVLKVLLEVARLLNTPRKETSRLLEVEPKKTTSHPAKGPGGKKINPNLQAETFPRLARTSKVKRDQITRRRLRLACQFLLDIALIFTSFIAAYFIRYVLQLGADVLDQNQVPLNDYSSTLVAYCAIFFVVLQFKGFYNPSRTRTFLDEVGIIFSTSMVSVSTMIVLVFISQPLTRSRLMFVYLVPLTVLLLALERSIARTIRRNLWLKGIGVRNLVIVGATDPAARLMQAIVDRPDMGYRLAGFVDDNLRFSEWIIPVKFRNGVNVPNLGPIANLKNIIEFQNAQEIIIALPAAMHTTIEEVVIQAREREVDYTFVPDIFELRLDALTFQEINGVPLIGLKDNSLTGWNYVIKRLFDILLSLVGIIICALPMVVIALAVKLTSPGGIIFPQVRVGKEGRPFTFYKFRSMYPDADKRLKELASFNQTGGATFKMVNDPRITPLGHLLRHFSLDELPQLFNILLGHMSFVGPRPGLPREVENYDSWHFRRLEVTPGLSGLWQVSGRSELSFEDMVKLDIYYAEHWSLWLDLKIIARTLPAVIKGRGAY